MTDGTHVTAGQLALALTPYAQVTDLAVNTAASGNNAAAIQSLDDRVTAELASKQLADHGPLQQGRAVGLRRAGGRGCHKEHPGRRGPEAVQLQHHGGHERFHRLGQQRHAGHGGRQLRPQDGGGPALPGHSGEDHAAGGGRQASKADASALTAYALQSAVVVDSKIAAALLDAVTVAALDAALLGKADASALASLLGHAAGGRHQDSKCPAGSRHRGLRRSAAC